MRRLGATQPPRHRRRRRRVSVAEVTSTPWAGSGTTRGEGHRRIDPVAMHADIDVARPRCARSANQSTNSGGVPWPSACSIARQPAISISFGGAMPRAIASMRSRVALSSSSASSSSRDGSASASGASAAASRASARSSASAASAIPGNSGMDLGLHAVGAVGRRRAGHRPAGGRARGSALRRRSACPRRRAGSTFSPAAPGQPRSTSCQRLLGRLVIAGDEVLDPPLQAARPPAGRPRRRAASAAAPRSPGR